MESEYLIIVAGGLGNRMNSDIPKQFIKIHDEPIIIITLKQFLKYNPQIKIIIAVHQEYKLHLKNFIDQSSLHVQNIEIVLGGETRFDSVKNALYNINETDGVVGIHDAARPLVSLKTIKTCFEVAKEKGNAIPAISINESLREKNSENNFPIDRTKINIIQTPQCFSISKIKKAFDQKYDAKFTDDATVFETRGEKINLVEGNRENIKITYPMDLEIAKIFIQHEQR